LFVVFKFQPILIFEKDFFLSQSHDFDLTL